MGKVKKVRAWATLRAKKDEIQIMSDGWVSQLLVFPTETSAERDVARTPEIKSRIVPITITIPVKKRGRKA